MDMCVQNGINIQILCCVFCVPWSMFRLLCSIIHVPCSMFCVLCSVFCVSCSVFHDQRYVFYVPCSILCSVFFVLCSVNCAVCSLFYLLGKTFENKINAFYIISISDIKKKHKKKIICTIPLWLFRSQYVLNYCSHFSRLKIINENQGTNLS
jgi:hypothetical protein